MIQVDFLSYSKGCTSLASLTQVFPHPIGWLVSFNEKHMPIWSTH